MENHGRLARGKHRLQSHPLLAGEDSIDKFVAQSKNSRESPLLSVLMKTIVHFAGREFLFFFCFFFVLFDFWGIFKKKK